MSRLDFLFELRTEEIPAPVLLPARLDLLRGVTEALAEEGLVAETAQSFATPRRLVLVLQRLPERQKDRTSEVIGPPASAAFDAD
jgi:glycyl-tRNA synthetase beta chain